MKKIIRLTESGFNVILKELIQEQKEIDEAGGQRIKPFWNEEDQLMALYNEKYGLGDIWPGEFRNDAQRREDFTNQVIGSSGASLLKQGLNFRRLRTKNTINPEGYSREAAEMQKLVFDKYDHMNRQELKNIVIDIIEKKLQNPDDSVSTYKEILKKNKFNATKDKALEAQLKLHDLDPKRYPLPSGYVKPEPEKRFNIRKSPEPELIPEPTPEIPSEPEAPEESPMDKLKSIHHRIKNASSPDEIKSMADEIESVRNSIDEKGIREYLRTIYHRMQNIKSSENINKISDEIEFIMSYIDANLSDEEQSMVAEMAEFVKNKKTLIESIDRIKNLNKIIK